VIGDAQQSWSDPTVVTQLAPAGAALNGMMEFNWLKSLQFI
jgi:hypothetical protein